VRLILFTEEVVFDLKAACADTSGAASVAYPRHFPNPTPVRLFSLWLFVLVSICRVCAVGSVRAESGWSLRTWDVEDGLPRNAITSLAQTADGFLWLTTTSHLVRFDGASFVEYPHEQLAVPRRSSPNRVYDAADGDLWVRLRGPAVFKFSAGRALPLDPRVPLAGVRWLIETDDELWLSYDDGSVYFVRGDNVRRYGAQDGVLPGGAQSFVRDAEGRIWNARHGHVSRLAEGKFATVFPETGATSRLVPAARDGVWAAIGSRLWRIFSDGRAEDRGAYTEGAHDPHPVAMMEDRDGGVWIGTRDKGLFRVTREGVEPVPTSHREISALLQDRDGNIWVGTTSGGLNRLQPRAISLLRGGQEESPFDRIRSICQDTDGVIWSTTQNNLFARLEDGVWRALSQRRDWPGGWPTCVAADPRGGIWIGTRSGSLHHLVDGQYTTYTERDGLQIRTIDTLLVARNGDVWIGGRRADGVQRLRAGQFHTFTVPSTVRTVHAMSEDAAGDIWTGSSSGLLLRFHGDEVINESPRLGEPSSIHAIVAGDTGVWIGMGGGLARLHGGECRKLSTDHGLFDNYISQIVTDREGWMWLGSSRGVFKIKLRDAVAFTEGRLPSVHSFRYGRGAGLPRMEGVHGVWPNSVRSADGRVWMPLQAALAVIDPQRFPAGQRQPDIFIQEVRVDERRQAFNSGIAPPGELVDLSSARAAVRMPPDHRHLEIVFGGLDLTAAENLRFRTRLEGFDAQWIEAGENRRAVYSRLPAGAYRFRVSARTSEGVWVESQSVLAIIVTPFFWETWWFRLCAVLLFTAVVVALVRYLAFQRLRKSLRLAREQAALDQERSRIARDIHDDVGNQLTEILLIADVSRRRPGMAAKSLEDITGTAHRIIKSLDEIVWAINPANDTLSNLVGYMAQFATHFLRLADLRCVLDLPPTVPERILATNVRHNIFLVVKEALHNAVKHARANEVTLRVEIEGQVLTIWIKDNGRGLEGGAAGPSSDGLRNMAQRMTAIGGTFQVDDVPGGGTCVVVSYSLLPTFPTPPKV
jgi:signal transduction histidine kinase/ligand-binding sensor domain-containing protein